MFSRRFRIFLVAFQLIWLNIVLPGHTRGMVTVPGWVRGSDAAQHDCCQKADRPKSDSEKPTPGDRAHCAICFFAAGLTVAAPIIIEVGPSESTCLAPAVKSESIACANQSFPFDSRGPPR